jgi:hypothetical protein
MAYFNGNYIRLRILQRIAADEIHSVSSQRATFPQKMVEEFVGVLKKEAPKEEDSGHRRFIAPTLPHLGTQVAQFFYDYERDEKWQSVGKGSVDMGKEHYICLGACNWGGTGAVTVEFDYFRSNPPIIMAIASPSGKIATIWGRLKQ